MIIGKGGGGVAGQGCAADVGISHSHLHRGAAGDFTISLWIWVPAWVRTRKLPPYNQLILHGKLL